MVFKGSVYPATILMIVLLAAVSCGGAEPEQAQTSTAPQQNSKRAEETFLVSGTIVKEDKSPVEGIKVQIVEAKGAGYLIHVGEGGVIEIPSQETDSKGKFSIKVKRSLFKDNQEFAVLAAFDGQQVSMLKLSGGVLVVKIDKTTKEYKLGEITRTHE